MADLLQEASKKYLDIPKDCFTANIDFHIKYFPDNEVVPRGDLSMKSAARVPMKWIKVSRFELFINACRAFGSESGGQVSPEALRVVVMPYIPLEDAFQLHELIADKDILSDSFDRALQHLGANCHNHQAIMEAPIEVEEEEDNFPITEEKVGNLAAADINVNVGFTVINYSVLWSKADTYCMLSFIADPIDMFISRIDSCNKAMDNRETTNIMEGLHASLEEARKQLIFAMYHERIPDAHNALLLLYPQIHNHVYVDCPHCSHQGDHLIEDSPATMQRLNQALITLGYGDYNAYLSVEQAEYNLMIAKGRVEFNQHRVEASLLFKNARQAFMNALSPIWNRLDLARKHLMLMGVVSAEEDIGQNADQDDAQD